MSKKYQIPLPDINANPVNFYFNATVNGNIFTLTFKWFKNSWHLWVTLPSGEIREASTVPGVVSWSKFTDYGFKIQSNLSVLGQNDIVNSQLFLIFW